MARVARAPCSPSSGQPEDGGSEPCAMRVKQGLMRRRCSHAEHLGCQPPASDAKGGLSSGGVQGGTRDGGKAPGSGGGQPGSIPAGSEGQAVRAVHRERVVKISFPGASALWPGEAQGMPFNQPQQVVLYTRCSHT